MTVLLLTFYVLTVTASYKRVKAWKPDWQMRAELTAMFLGVAAWLSLGAWIGTL